MKTFSVTGGTGFGGSNLTHHLYDEYLSHGILALDLLTYAGNVGNPPWWEKQLQINHNHIVTMAGKRDLH